MAGEIVGKRFGRLVVLSFAGHNRSKRRTYLCKCDCGMETTKDISMLRKYPDISCGCGKSEKLRALYLRHGGAEYIKGIGRSPTYQTWVGMRFRCRDTTDPDYGGRGISVCKRWDDFAAFLEDMGARPDGKEIDRIDPNGDYEPGNCRWVTHKVNSQNSRRRKLDVKQAGQIRDTKDRTAKSLAEEYGVSVALIYQIRRGVVWK